MDDKASFCFFQPSLLSKDQLIDILSERCIPRDQLTSKEKDELVEIFERVAKPLPCRKIRPSQLKGETVKSVNVKLQSKAEQPTRSKDQLSAFDRLAPSASLTRIKVKSDDTCAIDKEVSSTGNTVSTTIATKEVTVTSIVRKVKRDADFEPSVPAKVAKTDSSKGEKQKRKVDSEPTVPAKVAKTGNGESSEATGSQPKKWAKITWP